MKYSCIVKDEGKTVYIRNEEFPNMAEFIYSLRIAGYEVLLETVKESRLFEYILLKATADGPDWSINELPEKYKKY